MAFLAYVKFQLDNVREFVPVADIKNFHPKNTNDYDSSRMYLVKWRGLDLDEEDDQDSFYKAQILMLDVSKAKLQERIQKGRVHIPVVLDTSVESSSSEGELEIQASTKRVATDKKEKKKEKTAATNKTLHQIMGKHLQKKKKSPICPHPQVSKPSTSSCSSCIGLKRKLDQQRSQLSSTEELLRKAEKERGVADAELEEYRRLNKQLQEKILDKFGSNEMFCPDGASTSNEEDDTPAAASSSSSSSRSRPPRRHECTVKDGKVNVGCDLWIEEEKWDIIQMQKKHSMFVKHFVTSIWGIDGLKGRSVDGLSSKRALSPKKVKIVKDRFQDRLEEHGFSSTEKDYELAKFKKYLTEKIQDVNRKEKVPANTE